MLRVELPDVQGVPHQLRTIGDHVRKRRVELGLRQKDVGDLVGAAKPTVAGWEARGMRPRPDVLARVVELLGYTPNAARSPEDLVKQLKTVRRHFRLPPAVAAEMIGVSVGAVWTWESGRRRPRGRSLDLLRRFLARSSE